MVIGFDSVKKGFLFYMPRSRNIIVSADATFDETFHSAIATTWQQHKDTLALKPLQSFIPDVTTDLERTGTLGDNTLDDEEGEVQSEAPSVQSFEPIRNEVEGGHNDNDPEPAVYPTSPLIVDSSNNDVNAGPRRTARTHKPNPKYANIATIVGWADTCNDLELAEACATEAHADLLPKSNDANSWEPAPKSIRDVLKMTDEVVHQEWLKAIKKEIKMLVDSGTFVADTLKTGEISTPVMETFKDKVKSDGSLDKLKMRLVVQGDLQDKNITEDK